MTVPKCINNKSRTMEAQILQKLENNEARPKFTAVLIKKSVYFADIDQSQHATKDQTRRSPAKFSISRTKLSITAQKFS